MVEFYFGGVLGREFQWWLSFAQAFNGVKLVKKR